MPGIITVCCPDCGMPVDVGWHTPTVTHLYAINPARQTGQLSVALVLANAEHDCPDPLSDKPAREARPHPDRY